MSEKRLGKSSPEQSASEEQLREDEGNEDFSLLPAWEPLGLRALVSSLLFISNRPVTVRALSSATGYDEQEVEAALLELREMYSEEQFGFSLHEVGGGWQLRTSPRAQEIIVSFVGTRSKRISRAAAETLAVIAYKQPVQRAEIESIRGVDALPTIKTLLETRLIRIVGHADSPGNPTLYGTTQSFLERFGLKDLSDLPTPKELERMLREPGEAELSESAQDLGDDSRAEGAEAN